MILTYSKMSAWRNCPRQYHERYIAKRLPFEETPEMRIGTEKHKVLENCVRHGCPPPTAGYKIPPGLPLLLRTHGAEAEVRMAIDRAGGPAPWASAWLRGVIDVYLPRRPLVVMIDWKTGRPDYTDPLQAHVYAALCAFDPSIKRANFIFSYISHGVHKMFKLDPVASLSTVRNVANAMAADDQWLPKPSGLCGWCPVTTCEYHRRKK